MLTVPLTTIIEEAHSTDSVSIVSIEIDNAVDEEDPICLGLPFLFGLPRSMSGR